MFGLTGEALANRVRAAARAAGMSMASVDEVRAAIPHFHAAAGIQAVDLAIIGVLADGGLRRSEAAVLTWSDVEFWLDGTGRITIRKGKNQPDPQTVAVTSATARALQEIKE